MPEDQALQIHWHITSPDLTTEELELIIAFLGTLTDESLLPQLPKQVPSGLPVVDANYQKSHLNNNQYSGE